MSPREEPSFAFGREPLTLDALEGLARGDLRARFEPSDEVAARIDASAAMVQRWLKEGRVVYGVTTGFGASIEFGVDRAVAAAMPLNLLRYHGCGTGRLLSPEASAAVVAARLASISRGYSAVRPKVLDLLTQALDRRVLPAIPEEGSVGASGDLTPLSYVAALIVGEREALHRGKLVSATEALAAEGLEPIPLAPKESLAIMNGTSVMTALAGLGWRRAQRLAALGAALTAMASDVLRGEPGHFDDRIFALKDHPGQRAAARWIASRLGPSPEPPARVQDRYSLRCAPHVLGVLLDTLPFTERLLETELNGVNDNPILDPEGDRVLHGGNFYGGHACLAADTLKNTVANIADLLERQLVLLNNPATNAGLPPNLSGREGHDRTTHHGFKAMEITASALTAEALKLTMPASVFSRSTESHNQDKVSMGTIASRELIRILDLTETVAIVHLLACCQAVDLRGPERCRPASQAMRDALRKEIPMHDADRRMDVDIQAALALYRRGALPIDPPDFPERDSR